MLFRIMRSSVYLHSPFTYLILCNSLLFKFCSCYVVRDSFNVTTDQSTFLEEEENEYEASSKIYGGNFALKWQYPWYARPTTNYFTKWYGCGAQLVSSQFVLTAAHCIKESFGVWGAGQGYQIGALCSPYEKGNNCGQFMENINLKEVFVHPNYNPNNWDNDFALVSLQKASRIKPVEMDDGSISKKYPDGYQLWAAGLGATTLDGGGFPTRLMHVDLKYVKQWRCKALYDPLPWIKDSMMCTTVGAKDTLGGDSGGPLYDKQNKILVGLVSWGMSNPKFPGVYARVSHAYDWITETICANHNRALSEWPKFCVTPSPTISPRPSVSPRPSLLPSISPSDLPSHQPSIEPTAKPSMSKEPSTTPSSFPSDEPSIPPSSIPSNFPSISLMPSTSPSPTNTVYFKIQANLPTKSSLCLEPKNYSMGAIIVLRTCQNFNYKIQRWSYNQESKFICNERFPSRCIRKVGGVLKLLPFNPDSKTAKFTLTKNYKGTCVYFRAIDKNVLTIPLLNADDGGVVKVRPFKKLTSQCMKMTVD